MEVAHVASSGVSTDDLDFIESSPETDCLCHSSLENILTMDFIGLSKNAEFSIF